MFDKVNKIMAKSIQFVGGSSMHFLQYVNCVRARARGSHYRSLSLSLSLLSSLPVFPENFILLEERRDVFFDDATNNV